MDGRNLDHEPPSVKVPGLKDEEETLDNTRGVTVTVGIRTFVPTQVNDTAPTQLVARTPI